MVVIYRTGYYYPESNAGRKATTPKQRISKLPQLFWSQITLSSYSHIIIDAFGNVVIYPMSLYNIIVYSSANVLFRFTYLYSIS